MQELSNNLDAYWKSMYLIKRATTDGGKIAAGPVWDFDLAWGNTVLREGWRADTWAHKANRFPPEGASSGFVHPIWTSLWACPAFQKEVGCRWRSLRQHVLSEDSLLGFLEQGSEALNGPLTRDVGQWPRIGKRTWAEAFVGTSPEEENYWLRQWIARRLMWLDASMPACSN